MTCVLIKLYGGNIDDVIFFEDDKPAVIELAEFVKEMNVENDDASVFNQNGTIANAKTFLDENDEYIEDALEELLNQSEETKSVYIIGNPSHHLGFIVASPDDPLGYKESVEALSVLGQMRKDYGNHLKLYRVMPVTSKIAGRKDLENYNIDCAVEDFDYSLVEEYLIPH